MAKLFSTVIERPSFFWSSLKAVEKNFNVSKWYAFLNWLQLRYSVTRLSFEDYLAMNLFTKELSLSQKKEFFGAELWGKILTKYFTLEWLTLSEDKLFFYDIVRQHGYKSPKIYGLFHPYRRLNYAPSFTNKEQLKQFLHEVTYPCFTKPVRHYRSLDTFYLSGYDKENNVLLDHKQQAIPFDQFYKIIEPHYQYSGYLFQEVLKPDSRLAPISNHYLCTMRIIFIITVEGPECLGALLKIPTANNHADNFWRLGNIMAIIDQDTGKITQALQKTTYLSLPITHHPDTGNVFTDFQLPDWQKLKSEIYALASIFPMFLCQAWDIALTDKGWLPLEPNYGGDVYFTQWLYGRGLKSRIEAFLKVKITKEIWKD